MTTPPPPGSGDNQPYDPTGSSSYPTSGSTPGGSTPPPSSGSSSYPGAPAPSGAPNQYGAPQGGSDQTKLLSMVSMGTGIAGVVICCCWGLPIFSVIALVTGFIAKNQTKDNPRPDLKTFIMIGLVTGAIGIVISVVYWILVATGVIDINTTYNVGS